MDVVMVDVQWQGFGAAKKVADLAESYELTVAPHNYNGHLSTFQSLNLCASVSNVKIMESDPEHTPLARRPGDDASHDHERCDAHP